jgi:hypothetical protein
MSVVPAAGPFWASAVPPDARSDAAMNMMAADPFVRLQVG